VAKKIRRTLSKLEPEQQELQLQFRALRNALGNFGGRVGRRDVVLASGHLDMSGHAPELVLDALPADARKIVLFDAAGTELGRAKVSGLGTPPKLPNAPGNVVTVQIRDGNRDLIAFGLVRRT